MNSARLSTSARLQRVDRLLADGRERTTLEIMQGAQVCAISSIISELRENSRIIHCRRQGDIWYYRRDLLAEKRLANGAAA